MTRIFRHIAMAVSLAIAAIAAPVRAQSVPEQAADSIGASTTSGIVERLAEKGSSVTVAAPEQLLRRAAASAADAPGENAETSADGENTESEATETRPKGGKTIGYRVQVYADNNVRSAKSEARQRERMVGGTFPQWYTYVTYASPYWRLRIGDFRTQYEAEKAAADIRRQFPRYAKEVRVVRDRVNAR